MNWRRNCQRMRPEIYAIICNARVTKRRGCSCRSAPPLNLNFINDTIAAIATPLGEGGLAVIRISGPKTFSIADSIFEPVGRAAKHPSAAPTHTVHYGRIMRDGRQ